MEIAPFELLAVTPRTHGCPANTPGLHAEETQSAIMCPRPPTGEAPAGHYLAFGLSVAAFFSTIQMLRKRTGWLWSCK